TLFPYTTLFRSVGDGPVDDFHTGPREDILQGNGHRAPVRGARCGPVQLRDEFVVLIAVDETDAGRPAPQAPVQVQRRPHAGIAGPQHADLHRSTPTG